MRSGQFLIFCGSINKNVLLLLLLLLFLSLLLLLVMLFYRQGNGFFQRKRHGYIFGIRIIKTGNRQNGEIYDCPTLKIACPKQGSPISEYINVVFLHTYSRGRLVCSPFPVGTVVDAKSCNTEGILGLERLDPTCCSIMIVRLSMVKGCANCWLLSSIHNHYAPVLPLWRKSDLRENEIYLTKLSD